MTTNITLREAAQRALEALLNFPDDISDEMFESIRALKAALAQPPEPVQEPYCRVYEYDSVFGLHRELYPREYNGRKPDRAVPLYTAPTQRLPLTEEEIAEATAGVLGLPHEIKVELARDIERKVRGE